MKALTKWLKRVVWLAVLGAAGYYGWGWYQSQNAEQEQASLGAVPTEAAAVREITVSVSANGVLRPVRVVQVKSKASGEILEMPVDLGDEVRAGQLIAQIDTRILQQELAQAQADLESAQTRMEVSQRQFERANELHGQDLVSKQDLDTAQQNFSTARATLLRAEAELQLRQERLAEATVRAPADGRIIKKNVEVGTIITSSTSNVSGGVALVEMANLNRLEVRTLVDEIDIGRVVPGLPVETRVEAHPDRVFRGEVVKIEPQAEVVQQITVFPVLSYVDNTEGLLLPGMNANVDVIIHRRPGVLAVPNEAIRSLAEAEQVAGMLGIPFDRAALRSGPGDAELTDAGERRGSGPGAALVAEAQAAEAQEAEAPAQASEAGATEGEAKADEPIDFSKMRGMSAEERAKFIENLTPAQRKQLDAMREQMRQRFAQGGGGTGGAPGGMGGGGMGGGRPGAEQGGDQGPVGNTTSMAAFGIGQAPQEAVVFVVGADEAMKPQLVMAGVRDWEYTEIASGLRPGEKVVLLPSTSLLSSQQAMRDRFSRMAGGIPGTGGGRPR